MNTLDTIAERALSRLPEAEGSIPSLTGDTASPNSPTPQSTHTPQSRNFDSAVISNANNQPNSPEPISIGSPAYQPTHGYNAIPKATAETNTNAFYGTGMAPYRPSMLVTFLDHQFPGRGDSHGEMLDLGRSMSIYLDRLEKIFQRDGNPGNAASRLVEMLETIIHEWYLIGRPEVNETAKLRFVEYKLKLRVHNLGFEAEHSKSY
ncbi:hypothetical protein G7Z17_g10116 [Cylindrodendrum hubeiense]|uniref:Uncharacterized protein n=1 Tax=Cylindrodendrum hubeiense TaxID=595255 RepID=A0A9P5H2P6_9HYPO|nr:hypothetical protein G7Z17_g10116 [Cylindrodendrum hubeiense]